MKLRFVLTVAAVALLSAGFAHVLAQNAQRDRDALTSLIRKGLGLADKAPRSAEDTDEVRTGSILRRAENTRFNPCASK